MKEESPISITIIVAVADNGAIGRGGKLPWMLKSDLRRFRRLTMGHPLIMGRRTFESIGKPLDGRDTIVVTASDEASVADGILVAETPEEALAKGFERAKDRGVREIFVIGGARLFASMLPLADRLYLTCVRGSPEADTYWKPDLGEDWKEVSREERAAGAADEYPVTDLVLERVSPS